MKGFIFLSLMILSLTYNHSIAQVGINTDGSYPDNSAMLDIKSDSSGILIPRMDDASMNNIASPATGLMVYNTTENDFYYYNGATWVRVGSNSEDDDWKFNGNNLYNNNSGNVGIGNTDPSEKLDVNGNIKHGNALYLYSNASNGTHAWVKFNSPDNGWGDNIVLGAGGTTIIGAGESETYIKNNIDMTNGHEVLYFGSDEKDDNQAIRFITNLQDNDWNSKINAMTILGNGKVGIGETSPIGNLHIKSSNDAGPNGSDNPGADFMIGSLNAQHMEIDNNEIHSMSDADTGAILYINDGGGKTVFGDLIRIKPGDTPASPEEGDIYMDGTTHKLRCYDGSNWHNLWW